MCIRNFILCSLAQTTPNVKKSLKTKVNFLNITEYNHDPGHINDQYHFNDRYGDYSHSISNNSDDHEALYCQYDQDDHDCVNQSVHDQLEDHANDQQYFAFYDHNGCYYENDNENINDNHL